MSTTSNHEVKLYCYDLTHGMAAQLSLGLIGRHIEAIWHTAIVVFGTEYYFDGGVGIQSATPGMTRFGHPKRIDRLGFTTKTKRDLEAWNLRMMQEKFGPLDYNLLQRNCNHYSEDASQFLTGRSITEDVRSMIDVMLSSPLGALVRPMLESATNAVTSARGSGVENRAAQSSTRPESDAFSPEETDDLMINLALLESAFDDNFDGAKTAIETLVKILSNAVDNPSEAQFGRINRNSTSFTQNVMTVDGALKVLLLAGFVEKGQYLEIETLVRLSSRRPRRILSELRSILLSKTSQNAGGNENIVSSLRFSGLLSPNDCPLLVGSEANVPMYFGRVFLLQGVVAYGKAIVLSRPTVENPNATFQAKCWYIDPFTNKECETILCEVLVVSPPQAAEEMFTWVRLNAIGKRRLKRFPDFVVSAPTFEAAPAVAIIRAFHGGGLHPGHWTCNALPRIPYGGSGLIPQTSFVLCHRHKVPHDIVHSSHRLELAEEWATERRQRPMVSVKELESYCPTNKPTVHALRWTACPQQSTKFMRQSTEAHHPMRLLVCHDFKGGYQIGDELNVHHSHRCLDKTYTVSYWHHMDIFVYFSHYFLSLPPTEWISACHRHGVPILGTLLIEGNGSQRNDFISILQSSERMKRIVLHLVALCVDKGFDGYFFNVEASLGLTVVEPLKNLLGQLREGLRSAIGPHSCVIWYDSMTVSGALAYQNELNSHNSPFFQCSSAIFLNYWWNPQLLSRSCQVAQSRKLEVFAGIDVFGRRTFGGGGWTSNTALRAIQDTGVSAALFAPGWTLESCGAVNREQFRRMDDRYWGLLEIPQDGSPLCPDTTCVTLLPFRTTFMQPTSDRFFYQGELHARNCWCQLSAQSLSLSSRRVTRHRGKTVSVLQAKSVSTDKDGSFNVRSCSVEVFSDREVPFFGTTSSTIPLLTDTPLALIHLLALNFALNSPDTLLLQIAFYSEGTSPPLLLIGSSPHCTHPIVAFLTLDDRSGKQFLDPIKESSLCNKEIFVVEGECVNLTPNALWCTWCFRVANTIGSSAIHWKHLVAVGGNVVTLGQALVLPSVGSALCDFSFLNQTWIPNSSNETLRDAVPMVSIGFISLEKSSQRVTQQRLHQLCNESNLGAEFYTLSDRKTCLLTIHCNPNFRLALNETEDNAVPGEYHRVYMFAVGENRTTPGHSANTLGHSANVFLGSISFHSLFGTKLEAVREFEVPVEGWAPSAVMFVLEDDNFTNMMIPCREAVM